jgi:hypothetical protein
MLKIIALTTVIYSKQMVMAWAMCVTILPVVEDAVVPVRLNAN